MPAHHVSGDRSFHQAARPTRPSQQGRSEPTRPDPSPHDADRYRIRVGGHLDDRWADRLDVPGLSRQPDGTTVIDALAIDQAALHGLLGRIRDAGLRLISVTRIDPDTDPSVKETSR
jgi:hypothetical protein